MGFGVLDQVLVGVVVVCEELWVCVVGGGVGGLGVLSSLNSSGSESVRLSGEDAGGRP